MPVIVTQHVAVQLRWIRRTHKHETACARNKRIIAGKRLRATRPGSIGALGMRLPCGRTEITDGLVRNSIFFSFFATFPMYSDSRAAHANGRFSRLSNYTVLIRCGGFHRDCHRRTRYTNGTRRLSRGEYVRRIALVRDPIFLAGKWMSGDAFAHQYAHRRRGGRMKIINKNRKKKIRGFCQCFSSYYGSAVRCHSGEDRTTEEATRIITSRSENEATPRTVRNYSRVPMVYGVIFVPEMIDLNVEK